MSQENQPVPSIALRVLQQLATETRGRLDAAELITHPGERGRAREAILSTFLREVLPTGFEITTGFVIDANGGQSLQQDVIVVRKDYHPVFRVGGINFFTVEAVAAVVEVKSNLSGSTIREALLNGASVKKLDRTAGGENYLVHGGAGGKRGPQVNPEVHEHQIFSAIVAGRSQVKAETLTTHILSHLRTQARRDWPNVIAVAGEVFVAYDSSPRSDQMNATGLRLQQPEMPNNVDSLIDVAYELWSFLRVAPLVDVKPGAYVDGSHSGLTFPLPEASAPPSTLG